MDRANAIVVAIPDVCTNCGHAEDDHQTDDDHTYCLGNAGGEPLCRCHGYESPADEWEQ